MTKTAHTQPATTVEELRRQVYNLVAGHDNRLAPGIARSKSHWEEVKDKTLASLKRRGTPETLPITETVAEVLKTYRDKQSTK
ncbi:hypothetical protein D3C76_25670 [compost metagenome]